MNEDIKNLEDMIESLNPHTLSLALSTSQILKDLVKEVMAKEEDFSEWVYEYTDPDDILNNLLNNKFNSDVNLFLAGVINIDVSSDSLNFSEMLESLDSEQDEDILNHAVKEYYEKNNLQDKD